MTIMLLVAAAVSPQSSWMLPPPRLDPDTTITYSAKNGGPRPGRPPAWHWRRARMAPPRPVAVMPAVGNIGLRRGDILIDTARHRLMFAAPSGRVETFPVAVGKWGARWKGTAVVGRKAVLPTWRPTAHMRSQQRSLPSVVGPGRHNPLGTRAIYLFRNGRDTLFRIHGTNAPWSIGKSVSHGCIRMFNASIEHLFGEVRLGAHVTVR